jgi:serine/threonine protein kinase
VSKETRCLSCMSEMGGASACPSCGWQMSSQMDNALYLPAGYLLNNRYTVGKVLGVGGFGIVYIAWDTNLDIRVAIKEFLPKEYAARSSNHVSITPYTGNAHDDFSLGVEKFLDEAKALARFQEHPGIVTVHESFRTNNTAYMVMQYLDGMTLKEYLKRQPGEKIAFNVAVKAMTPIMDALREVHKAGFVHRDISPDNIFLTNQNQVKLLDFGSARYAIGEHSKSLTSVLKHGYAPVEQYSAKGRQGPWSDVYAVCATIYRCVTGVVPTDAMERIQGDTIESPKQLGIDVPLSGRRAIMRGLALKAVDRFENIQQLQQALAIEDKIIACPECGTKNRTPSFIRDSEAKCGRCGNPLFRENKKRQSIDEWENRTPCADGGCVGIIGSTGRCTQCGKTYEEGISADKQNRVEWSRQRQASRKSSSKFKKKFIYGTVGFGLLVLLFVIINLSPRSSTVEAPAPKPSPTVGTEKSSVTQPPLPQPQIPKKTRKEKSPSVITPSSVSAPKRSTPASADQDLITVGKYLCKRNHYNRAQELDPPQDEKISIDIEREALASMKREIETDYVDNYSQDSVDRHNALIEEFNSRRRKMNISIERYNAKVKIHNDYLMNNCSRRN